MTDTFFDYLRYERNRSLLTVKSYAEDLDAFEAYFKKMEDSLSWDTVDADVVRDWVESMMDKGNSATSVRRRLSALRSFYRFALSRGLVEKNPMVGVKSPRVGRPLPQFVREDEMERLLEPDAWADTWCDTRARTIILLFYSTGVRLSELVGLNDVDIDFSRHELKVTGKRNKQRIIPFGEELADALKVYMAQREKVCFNQDGAFFVDDKGVRLLPGWVRKTVQRHLGRVCTLKKLSPHVLRHTFATAMLNHDAGLESVKQLLGHESLSTTEIYTHTTFEQLKRVYSNAHPRA